MTVGAPGSPTAFAPACSSCCPSAKALGAFGSEEPRGTGDAHHHYGSRAYVASLTRAERRGLRGMIDGLISIEQQMEGM